MEGREPDLELIDQFVALQPCALKLHFPFKIALASDAGNVIPYGSVRFGSSDWDGCGGRTDLHDVFGLAWAASLRASGAASSQVWIDIGWAGSPEISRRFMFFDQPYSSAIPLEEYGPVQGRLLAHTAWAAHGLMDAFHLRSPGKFRPRWSDEKKPTWLLRLSDILGDTDDGLWVTRKNPDWDYYTDAANGIMIVKLPKDARSILNHTFSFYEPQAVQVGPSHILRAHGLVSCIASSAADRATEIISRIEGRSAARWTGAGSLPDENQILTIPLESHCLFFGKRSIVALATPSGAAEFDRARTDWAARSATEAAIFNVGMQWQWAPKLDPLRFEKLIEALLSEETGLVWVRATGPTYERDQGRDLVAMWLTPPGLGDRASGAEAKRPAHSRKIVIQAKVRGKTVGKGDVRDVRDTLERHDAEGFLLVAHPGWSNDLFNYLESLAAKGPWVNVWGPSQIEERLRKRPHIAKAFQDLVTEIAG